MDGHRCLSPLMCKAKAHSQYGQDIVDSERWQQQRQLQQQSHIRFQRLGSFEDTTCIKECGRLIGGTPTAVRVSGNEHDRSASNAVMLSKYATEYLNVRFLPGTATLPTNIYYTTGLISTISEAEHHSGAC